MCRKEIMYESSCSHPPLMVGSRSILQIEAEYFWGPSIMFWTHGGIERIGQVAEQSSRGSDRSAGFARMNYSKVAYNNTDASKTESSAMLYRFFCSNCKRSGGVPEKGGRLWQAWCDKSIFDTLRRQYPIIA